MKKWNEKGYSLIIVLFVIIIFSVIGISLFTMTLSNTKQIAQVEKQMVAVDLAEMGAMYYDTVFKDYSRDVLIPAIKTAISEIETENAAIKEANAKNTKKEPQPLLEITVDAILDRLNRLDVSILPPVDRIKIDEPILVDAANNEVANNFKILEHTKQGYDASSKKFIITFKSNGYTADGEQATLNGKVEVDMDQFITDYSNSKTSFSMQLPPELESLNNPSILCEGNAIKEGCLYKGNYTINNDDVVGKITGNLASTNNESLKNSLLYVNGYFNTGNKIELNNTTLYINNYGDPNSNDPAIKIDNNTLVAKNGTRIISNGSFVIEQNLTGASKIEDSIFIINGDFTFKNLNTAITKTKIFVKGTLLTGKINGSISPNSTICAGELKGGIVDYKNLPSNLNLKIYSYKTDYKNQDDADTRNKFIEACGQYFSSGEPNDLLNQMEVEYD